MKGGGHMKSCTILFFNFVVALSFFPLNTSQANGVRPIKVFLSVPDAQNDRSNPKISYYQPATILSTNTGNRVFDRICKNERVCAFTTALSRVNQSPRIQSLLGYFDSAFIANCGFFFKEWSREYSDYAAYKMNEPSHMALVVEYQRVQGNESVIKNVELYFHNLYTVTASQAGAKGPIASIYSYPVGFNFNQVAKYDSDQLEMLLSSKISAHLKATQETCRSATGRILERDSQADLDVQGMLGHAPPSKNR